MQQPKLSGSKPFLLLVIYTYFNVEIKIELKNVFKFFFVKDFSTNVTRYCTLLPGSLDPDPKFHISEKNWIQNVCRSETLL